MQRYPPLPAAVTNPMAAYKARRKLQKADPLENYQVLGYIAAGTYGRVYKAQTRPERTVESANESRGPRKESVQSSAPRVVAIKKFKLDKEGERATYYTGLSQSAYREMALCRELQHENVVALVETILENKSIYLVFDYAEHDLLQIIQYHHCHPSSSSSTEPHGIPLTCIKSIMHQVLQGVAYLHENWVLHRDIKPANIMITAQGRVKVGDLGLARLFKDPLQTLYAGDKVVVTIWYRAPELLVGSRHYTPAIDVWAVGCVFAEMLALRPIFKGEETKMDNKKVVPFQRNQMQKVVDVLGTPTKQMWPEITSCPDWPSLAAMPVYPNRLASWLRSVGGSSDPAIQQLLQDLLNYNPNTRVAAQDAVNHAYFRTDPKPQENAFEGFKVAYPARKITDTTSSKKRGAAAMDTELGTRKKQRA